MSIIVDSPAQFAESQQSIAERIPLYMRVAYSIFFRTRTKTVVGTVGIPTSHHDRIA